MHEIQAITLDLDDTLWDIHPVIEDAENKLWDWLGTHYPNILGCFDREMVIDLRKDINQRYPNKSHDYRFIRKLVLKKVFSLSGYDEKFAEDAFHFFDVLRNKVKLYDDVLHTLNTLVGQVKIIALTNGNANLEMIGINHLFHDAVYAADAGYPKPDVRIFNEAIRRSGARIENILHVGDHPENDIVGAANAGLRTVWMNPKFQEWPDHLNKPDITISRISELCDLLLPGINP
ncbi:MAG: HAD family hydrolase [Pseudomonadota bacterium]|nr:HAD family hydrolase [Pseudomonadota bacterium]